MKWHQSLGLWRIVLLQVPGLTSFLIMVCIAQRGFPGGRAVRKLPANAGDARDVGLMPGLGRSGGGGNGNPLQYSCPENSMYRGAWLARGHEVTKSQT